MFEDTRESPVETGWFWLSSRYYSPELCRFISPDDVEYLDPESVNGLNLYCYCLNNPIMYADPSGHMPEWLETTLKIVGGVTIIAGCIVGSIFTGGMLSVILAGAAVGAIAGGVSAGISTAVSGGSIHDFGSAFLMSTITGAASGAVCASPLGMWAQAGINAGISALTYVGTQLMNEDNITLGGLVSSSIFGFATGAIGGNGWMQSSGVKAFIESGAKGFIKNIVSNVGISSLVRIGAPAVGLGGISSALYGKYVANKYNPNGNFWGW